VFENVLISPIHFVVANIKYFILLILEAGKSVFQENLLLKLIMFLLVISSS